MQLTADKKSDAEVTEVTEAGDVAEVAEVTESAERGQDADGMAVASFVLGLVGLLVLNIFLGPIAIVLAGLALIRGTARRGRALLGLGLGIADLVVLASFIAADGTLSWSIAG
ncbi:DUF4190 domain-containing protein [Streptomyces sp. NPDC050145]|uniref:DUF4190 domain-containing protein n=1 Tax=Streptomyces sp. NPDC050145 TaxID=3365602 RepID=UPI0037A2C579